MTKEKAEEWLSILQAYAEGKTVQKYVSCTVGWEWRDVKDLVMLDKPDDYRIKPSPACRPFKDGEELVAEFCKRFGVERKAWEMPNIWVADKLEPYIKRPVCLISEREIDLDCGEEYSFDGLLNGYTFLDGSPCGVKEASDASVH